MMMLISTSKQSMKVVAVKMTKTKVRRPTIPPWSALLTKCLWMRLEAALLTFTSNPSKKLTECDLEQTVYCMRLLDLPSI